MSVPDPSPTVPEPQAPAKDGIPEAPVGTPVFGEKQDDADDGRPVGPTPAFDFWQAIYTRRSIRKFKPDMVPRDLVAQVMHAGIWAPSSCNYQMWDLVAVDDPAVNAKLAALSLQMGNAPVNIVVSYGRDFSEEGWANVQSASAAIENMSLAAHVLGLGTFWITQMGDREKVRETVGLPEDRLVVAVLALGYPKITPKKGPKRRPMAHVTHFNHYAGRPIPSSTNPADWAPDLLAVYQRARVLNGLRHNKPRAWEARAITEALERLIPGSPAAGAPPGTSQPHWLDVLPCTGIVTEKLWGDRPQFAFDIAERTREVAEFVSARTRPRAGMTCWPRESADPTFTPPREASYDVVSCLFRLENLPPKERESLLHDIARWLKPGGRALIGFVNKRSYHDWTEWLRRRRGGPKGVEYVLAPDPNIGPFESLDLRSIERMANSANLRITARYGCQAVPPREEIEFRSRNFSPRSRRLARSIGWLLSQIERLPGLRRSRGRFQFLTLTRDTLPD